ncbi:hypothetical protein jhhlp_006166 [Lomentospora prolificans]|uniref:CCHC-type domain-containing protein n=1 Tax=Lomentospora prolificans TaxID=41688 RepID=A0A2N3N5B4_9PEZI|nr:hypothetical protein jhhlp_006166 [Lomentospora prolificans]
MNGTVPQADGLKEEVERTLFTGNGEVKGEGEGVSGIDSGSGSEEGQILEDEEASEDEASDVEIMREESDSDEGSTHSELEDGQLDSKSDGDASDNAPSLPRSPESSDLEEKEGAARTMSQSSSSSPSESLPQASGWNKGITSGQVRISLGSMTKTIPSLAPTPKTTPTTNSQKNATLLNSSPENSLTHILPKSKVSLRFPTLNDRKGHVSWKVRFQEWASALRALNQEKSPLPDHIILEAYSYYIDRVSNIHNKKRKPAKEAAKAVLQGPKGTSPSESATVANLPPHQISTSMKGTLSGQIPGNEPSPRNQPNTPGLPTAAEWERALEGSNSQSGPDVAAAKAKPARSPFHAILVDLRSSIPTGQEEFNQQTRYFPGLKSATDMCVLCLQGGHKASDCQACQCQYCEDKEQHPSYLCPTKQRCKRCCVVGHTVNDCPEEEHNVPWGPELRCVYCDSANHRDEHCDSLWRTFDLNNLNKKVHSILAFCAHCGEEGHYIAECSENRTISHETLTWSLDTLHKCIDESSRHGPISEFKSIPVSTGLRPHELQRPELVGRTPNVIHFDSDDSDADAGFLAGRVQPKKPAGRISLSTNIQFAGALGSSASQRRSQQAQGAPASRPPPQGPATGGGRPSDDRRSVHHQLPPRPPTPSAPTARRGGFHSVPPPPGLHRDGSQGNGRRKPSNGGGSRGGKDKGSRRGGRRGGGFRGSRGGGGWA